MLTIRKAPCRQAPHRPVTLTEPRPATALHAGPHPRLEGRGFARARLLLDLLAVWSAVAVVLAWHPREGLSSAAAAVLVFPLLSSGLLLARGQYRQQLRPLILDELLGVTSVISLSAMSILAAVLVAGWNPHAGPLIVETWGLALILAAGARFSLVLLQRHRRVTGRAGRPVLIVGAGLVGAHIARRLRERPEYGLDPVGFIDPDPVPTLGLGDQLPPVVGMPDEIEEIVRATAAKHVIVSFTRDVDRKLVSLVRCCQSLGVEVSLVPRLFDVHNDRLGIEYVGGLPLITMRRSEPDGTKFAVKHLLDRVGAAVLLTVLMPLLIGIAVAIKLTSAGPVLFRQSRVGRDGQLFDLFKFRSMREADDAPQRFRPGSGLAPGGVEGEDRRTPLGRWLRRYSVDELPQLLNVLKGEMSLIGPRPERPEFVELFRQDIERYGERHRVKAGITGWAQVHGLRGQTSVADRVEWDNYYIENWSLKLDLRIAALTVIALLSWHHEA